MHIIFVFILNLNIEENEFVIGVTVTKTRGIQTRDSDEATKFKRFVKQDTKLIANIVRSRKDLTTVRIICFALVGPERGVVLVCHNNAQPLKQFADTRHNRQAKRNLT